MIMEYATKAQHYQGRDVNMTEFKERFKTLRLQRGFKTQKDLSAVSGVTQQQISAYERGSIAGGDVLAKLARALKTTSDYLLGLIDDDSPAAKLSADEREILNMALRGELNIQTARLAQRLSKLPEPIYNEIVRLAGLQ